MPHIHSPSLRDFADFAGALTQSLRRYLADRDLLLVLDNCEHVVDACAKLAASLLASCGNLRIRATSRESFGVSGETVWRLDSPGFPPRGAAWPLGGGSRFSPTHHETVPSDLNARASKWLGHQ